MKTWAAIGLALVGAGHGLLSGGVAFAEEKSPYCAKAREVEAEEICGFAEVDLSCTATVDGELYYWRAVSCDDTRKGIYYALCLREVTDHSPLHFECCDLRSPSSSCHGYDEPTSP